MKNIFLVSVILILVACEAKKEVVVSTDLNYELLQISEQTNPTQNFEIIPTRDTLIQGSQGTEIFIQANTLIFQDGKSVSEPVTISLREFYEPSQMILNNLSTTSNGRLLATSGMINLTARSEGKDLKLKSENIIKIKFKKISDSPYMRTFLGEKDSIGINWILDENSKDTITFTSTINLIARTPSFSDTIISSRTITYGVVGLDTFEINRTTIFNTLEDLNADTTNLPFPIYELNSSRLNWINCDYFVDNDTLIDIYLSRVKNKSSRSFLVFNDINSIMYTWEYNDSTSIYRNIPFGSDVSIISIATDSTDYYLATKNKKLDKHNEQIALDYRKITISELQEELKKLEFDQ